jgi:hypothetical protein
MMKQSTANNFSIKEYRGLIQTAKASGYTFLTLEQFVMQGCPKKGIFILRHDLDKFPVSLHKIVEAEAQESVVSTIFIRVAGADYNPLGYTCTKNIQYAIECGCEIGLHTGCVEFAHINRLISINVLAAELSILRKIGYRIHGIAPHRDINYMYNTLPWLEENWDHLSIGCDLIYHAYEKKILDAAVYVAETMNPHLCWRNDPNEVIATGRSVYMLTHPHWWYDVHAFEDQ